VRKNANPNPPKYSGAALLEIVRTAMRALETGPDSIRTLRLRETLRPLAEEHRARLGLADGR